MSKRVMYFKYYLPTGKENEILDRLRTCLDMCCIKYKIYPEYTYTDGTTGYEIFIDNNNCTWEQVMREVNRVKAAKYKFRNDIYFRGNELCCDCGTIRI